MNTHRGLVAALVGLVALAAGCSEPTPPRAESRDVVLDEGDVAPPFELPTSDGRRLSLSDFRGKKAVLLYFSMGPG